MIYQPITRGSAPYTHSRTLPHTLVCVQFAPSILMKLQVALCWWLLLLKGWETERDRKDWETVSLQMDVHMQPGQACTKPQPQETLSKASLSGVYLCNTLQSCSVDCNSAQYEREAVFEERSLTFCEWDSINAWIRVSGRNPQKSKTLKPQATCGMQNRNRCYKQRAEVWKLSDLPKKEN